MKSIKLEELKRIQLDILVDIHNFCQTRNINYSLAYGTLLGAIRHKGYIPWDDDIDIMMLRPDYERFVNTFSDYCDYLDICAPELDLKYYAPYANVWNNKTCLYEGDGGANYKGTPIGVKIDIFPIDKTSSNRLNSWISIFLYNLWCSYRYRKVWENKNIHISIARKIINIIANFLGYENIQRLIIKNAKRLSKKDTKKLDMLVFYNFGDRKFNVEDFNSYVNVEFEGHIFKSIVGYDDYLKNAFGDYMQLPPEDKRVSHHNFEAFWI